MRWIKYYMREVGQEKEKNLVVAIISMRKEFLEVTENQTYEVAE